jgi:hypothetical protein
MQQRAYPNVRLRFRRTAKAPGLPESEARLVLWSDGARFHLRDETGRSYPEILDDVTAPRGLGRVSRTIEDLMDAWGSARRQRAATDIFADLDRDVAVVAEEGGQPWSADAARLVGLADQAFAGELEERFAIVGEQTFLGRSCTEYRFSIQGEDGGVSYRSDVSWLVSAPYLLRRHVRDAPAGRRSVLIEVIELAEGVVTADDLRLPGTRD